MRRREGLIIQKNRNNVKSIKYRLHFMKNIEVLQPFFRGSLSYRRRVLEA